MAAGHHQQVHHARLRRRRQRVGVHRADADGGDQTLTRQLDERRQAGVERAVEALRPYLVGRALDATLADLGGVWRELVHDSQLRWLGPEKGVMHMAIGAVINALWDLKAKRAGVPLWQLLSRMAPEEIVSLVDFRYLTDALAPEEALAILERAEKGRGDREQRLLDTGYLAYTTSPGWLGYDDDKLRRLCREALAQGVRQIKLRSAPTSPTTCAG